MQYGRLLLTQQMYMFLRFKFQNSDKTTSSEAAFWSFPALSSTKQKCFLPTLLILLKVIHPFRDIAYISWPTVNALVLGYLKNCLHLLVPEYI